MRLLTLALVGFLLVGIDGAARAEAPQTALDLRLKGENAVDLAREARASGSPARGAILFYQPQMTCAKCHVGNETSGLPLGPDLALLGAKATGAEVVESILDPSKTIRQGFESVTIATKDGRVVTGLLGSERPLALVIRDLAQDGKPTTILRADIEERKNGGPSLMPAGLVNLLGTRQEFLDLVSYVLEIAEKGPARAKALAPASAFSPVSLPDYERNINHKAMIEGLGAENLKRGEAIYQRLCINCHGTKDQAGSLPTSLRFASGTFKNGSDPYRMYQTLTHGFGQMAPQAWMAPEQKYDVIHYIREAYLKPYHASQYTTVDLAYLEGLPKGTSRGPGAVSVEPWVTMDYGPSLMLTVEVGDSRNFAYKGIATRLDAGAGGISRGKAWTVFDHDTLRAAAGWTGSGFIDWNGINFNGQHGVHPRVVGQVVFSNPGGPGWADPKTGLFDDPRLRGRDGRPYGPLPKGWAHYRGMYQNGDRVVIASTIGGAEVLETFGLEVDPSGKMRPDGGIVFTRTMNLGPVSQPIVARAAAKGGSTAILTDGFARLGERDGFRVVEVPVSRMPTRVKLLMSNGPRDALARYAGVTPPPDDLAALTKGGPRRWTETLKTRSARGSDEKAYAVDVLNHPVANPWNCQLRFSGFDFLPGGKALAACTWDGDVWRVDGIEQAEGELSWRRIASGLFQPLGLKVLDGRIVVSCRDQIVVLRDLNGDGETDFYENFNSDHQVTEHFHEFAMDLQSDEEGNLYYAKAARHGKKAVVPQHGTLLKVSKDGAKTEILANGFRAPNGVCLNADGSFFLTDQEGFWHPKNRINRVVKGGFYGNMWGFTDVTDASDSAMEQPLCWVTNAFDRSPGAMVRVPRAGWGLPEGSMLELSYGMGKVFVVPHETVNGKEQGGMIELPGANFPTGVMRGRFRPLDNQLYLCGMYSWAGNREQPGGFYRLRSTGKPAYVPVGLHAGKRGIEVTFSEPVEKASATDRAHYAVSTWSLKRSENYGSEHHNEKTLEIHAATLSNDGRTVRLEIPGIAPTWGMEIVYQIRGAKGEVVEGRIHNTIHELGE